MRRKICNNLKKIEETYPGSVDIDPKQKEHTYRLTLNAPTLLKPMTQEQIMAFGLLSKFGTDLLTLDAQKSLAPFYRAAQNAAVEEALDAGRGKAVSSSLAARWLQKIAVVPAVLPFCPPQVDASIRQTVHEALLLESRLKMTVAVANTPSGIAEECEVSPLALVQQGVRTYLIAKRVDEPVAERFLLARILQARQTLGTYQKPAGWNLETFLMQGIGHPVFPKEYYGRVEQLVLKVNADTQWIKETPLAPNPVITDCEDGSYYFKVSLPMTESLCHWLLSMAFHVKVVEPAYLAERIRSDLQRSLDTYNQAHTDC
jgi:predicted DNA-binding transcriptional regulator YafY